MNDIIVIFKNPLGETVAFKLERLGRYRDIEHLKEVYPNYKIVTPDGLPKVVSY